MFRNHYDIIIIGGGPSGSTCGIFLKKVNPELRVCIIDKQYFPRNKPCGDGLGPGVVKILRETDMDISFLQKHPVASFDLSCGKAFEIRYDMRNLFEGENYGFVCERERLDDKLIGYAMEVGVDVFQKYDITDIYEVNSFYTQITCRNDQTVGVFTGRIIVGADGYYSKIRSYLNIPVNKDNHLGIGLRYYCKIKSPEKLVLRLDIRKSLKHSYGWLFPMSDDKANVGIGVDSDVYKRRHINLNKEFTNYLTFLQERMDVQIIPGTRAGYPLPYGSQMPGLINGNKVLIGDAASMVNPLTGEGIFYGMYAGKKLAGCIGTSFGSDSTLEQSLHNFSDGFRKEFDNHYRINNAIKKILSSSFSDLYLNMLKQDQALLNKVMNIILGNANSLDMRGLRFKALIKLTKYFYEQLKTNLSK